MLMQEENEDEYDQSCTNKLHSLVCTHQALDLIRPNT
jgi:hypothetical protein